VEVSIIKTRDLPQPLIGLHMHDLYSTFSRAFATTTIPLSLLLLMDEATPDVYAGVLIITTIISVVYTLGWSVAQR
jgi:hypothetical protein